jgi:hypothetical protein
MFISANNIFCRQRSPFTLLCYPHEFNNPARLVVTLLAELFHLALNLVALPAATALAHGGLRLSALALPLLQGWAGFSPRSTFTRATCRKSQRCR